MNESEIAEELEDDEVNNNKEPHIAGHMGSRCGA